MFQQSDTASPATKRAAKHEWELSHIVLQTVFLARDTAQLQQLLQRDVYEHKYFAKLPKYRQIALDAYFRGVCDAVARVAGIVAPLSTERPKTVPPPRKNKPRKTVPPVSKTPMYPTPNAPTAPLPDWARPTMIPPPTLHSPFPPAADLHARAGAAAQ